MAEIGRLRESAWLVEERDGVHRNLLHVALGELPDGTWAAHLREAQGERRKIRAVYATEDDTRAVLADVYETGRPLGHWQVSRFGPPGLAAAYVPSCDARSVPTMAPNFQYLLKAAGTGRTRRRQSARRPLPLALFSRHA